MTVLPHLPFHHFSCFLCSSLLSSEQQSFSPPSPTHVCESHPGADSVLRSDLPFGLPDDRVDKGDGDVPSNSEQVHRLSMQ